MFAARRTVLVVALMAAVTAATWATDPGASACPQQQYGDEALLADGATIYATGGAILTVRPNTRHRLTVKDAGGRDRDIAPLLRVSPPAAGATEAVVLDGVAPYRRYPVIADPAALAAPAIADARSTSKYPSAAEQRTLPGHGAMTVTVALAHPPPAEAFAIVVYRVDGSNAQPIGWSSELDPARKQLTFAVPGGKGCMPSAAPIVFVGDRIAVAWLDRGGRLSARSATTAVGAAPK